MDVTHCVQTCSHMSILRLTQTNVDDRFKEECPARLAIEVLHDEAGKMRESGLQSVSLLNHTLTLLMSASMVARCVLHTLQPKTRLEERNSRWVMPILAD